MFDSFVLQLCIDKRDTDTKKINKTHSFLKKKKRKGVFTT